MIHMTPWEYLLEYRLSRSLELLDKKDLSISEIAEMTGFSTVSYYITAFKKENGGYTAWVQEEQAEIMKAEKMTESLYRGSIS